MAHRGRVSWLISLWEKKGLPEKLADLPDKEDLLPDPNQPVKPRMTCYTEMIGDNEDVQRYGHLQTLMSHPRLRFIGRY